MVHPNLSFTSDNLALFCNPNLRRIHDRPYELWPMSLGNQVNAKKNGRTLHKKFTTGNGAAEYRVPSSLYSKRG